MGKKICSRCILDSTVPEISFDDNGVCQYCKIYDEMSLKYPIDSIVLDRYIKEIKIKGKNRKYDCIVGVSGGKIVHILLPC